MTQKKITIPIQLIELEDKNYHILIETEFKNGDKGKWAIDTGASKTVFDVNFPQHFKLLAKGDSDLQSAGIVEAKIETQSGLLHLLKLGKLELNHFPVALIDLQFINNLYQQFTSETLVGLLGSDFLVNHKAIIDYKKLVLTLYFEK
jgi:hypothetical protein